MQVTHLNFQPLITVTASYQPINLEPAEQQASDILAAFASAFIPLGVFFAVMFLTVFLLIIGADVCMFLVREMEARMGITLPIFRPRNHQQGVVPYRPSSPMQASNGSRHAESNAHVWVPPAELDAETLEELAWLEGELDEPVVKDVHPFLGDQFGINAHRKK